MDGVKVGPGVISHALNVTEAAGQALFVPRWQTIAAAVQ